MSQRLTKHSLQLSVRQLCNIDPDLKKIIQRLGPPPLRSRRAGFATLVMIILEQQVSLASAKAIYASLANAVGTVKTENIANMSEKELRECGITRQKAGYIRDLALMIEAGELNLSAIHGADDETAKQELIKIRGIGPWTAEIYLLSAMGRPDIWPTGDLALAESMRVVKGLRKRPSTERQLQIAEKWRPWRSIAARVLWHSYLS